MKCPVCLNEINEESICPVCGADIDIQLDNDNIVWKLLISVDSLIEAEMLKANLESADIPVFVFSKQDTAYRMSVNDFSAVEVLVPEQFLNEAKNVLKDINEE
jgi:hypothetical protein